MEKKKPSMKEVLRCLHDLSGDLYLVGEPWGSEQLSMLWATLDGHGWEDISEWIEPADEFWRQAEKLILSGRTEELNRLLDLVDDEGQHWKIIKFEYSKDWDSMNRVWRPVLKALLERAGPREWSPQQGSGRPSGILAPAVLREESGDFDLE